jgi:hypothetical protein
VNPLTMWLTLATFVGYAVIYTVILKPRDAAEHRDRRRLGRDAAGARLGGDHRRRDLPAAAALPHHLRLDAAALLGARALLAARSTRAPACRCCR